MATGHSDQEFLEGWGSGLVSRDRRARLQCLYGLRSIAPDDSRVAGLLPELFDSLRDPDEDISFTTAEVLANLGAAALAGLITALADGSMIVREHAAHAIGSLAACYPTAPSRAAAQPLMNLLTDPVIRVRAEAVAALRHVQGDEKTIVSTLIGALKNEDNQEVRDTIIITLGAFVPQSKAAVSVFRHYWKIYKKNRDPRYRILGDILSDL